VLIQTHVVEKLKVLSIEELRKSLDSGVFDADSLEIDSGDGLLEAATPSEASE
jgi:hypothetical protein